MSEISADLNSQQNSWVRPLSLQPASHARQQQCENELLLTGIISSALDAIIVIDEAHCILLFNPAAERMFRCPAATVMGEALESLIPTRFRAGHATLMRAFAQGTTKTRAMGYPVEIFGQRADGEEFPIEASIAKLAVAGRLFFTVILRDITERKAAEQALRTSEASFRELANAMPQVVFTTDAAGNFTYHNLYTEKMVGQVTPDTWLTLFHPADRTLVHQQWRQALQTGTPYQVEHRLYNLVTNEYRWYLGRALPIRDEQGQITKWYGTATDIHDQKQATTELQRTSELLRAVTNGATDAIFVKGCDGTYLLCNPATAHALGRTPAEILGKDDRALFSAPTAESIIARDQRVMGSGSAEIQESQLIVNGVTKTYLSTKAPYRDEKGNIIGVIGISHDITARKEAEEAIRASEQRLQMALGAARMGVWEWVAATNTLFWSTECKAIFGVQHFGETIEDFARLIHPEDAARTVQTLEEALFNQENYVAEFRIVRPDDELRWVAHRGQGTYDETGHLARIVGTVQDITERVQLEEQLRQSQKMEAIGQLAGGVAHDFNNLLTVITGYSDLLLTKFPADDRNRTFVNNIRHAGERATALTRQLLAFSRKQVLEPKVIDLNEVVTTIEKMLNRLIGEDILLTVVLTPHLDKIKVDPHQIEQVLMNLALNARDAMPEGGQLTIETHNIGLDRDYCRFHPESKPGRYVQLVITDTGCGMTPAIKSRIFEPFFTTKGAGKGTGLGLATVFGIIKQSEGHIEVSSEVGYGSCFKIYLPVNATAAAAAPAALSSEPVSGGQETILLVEDDDAVREVMRLALESHGYQVLEANDGAKAIKVVETDMMPLDLLITDLVMPQMGGRQLAQRLQEHRQQLKVLFMSGYIDDAVVRHTIVDNQSAFIHKPFSPTALAQKVREVLDEG